MKQSKAYNIISNLNQISLEEVQFDSSNDKPIIYLKSTSLKHVETSIFKDVADLVDLQFLENHNPRTITYSNLVNNPNKKLIILGSNTFIPLQVNSSYEGTYVIRNRGRFIWYDSFYNRYYGLCTSLSNTPGNDPNYGYGFLPKLYLMEIANIADPNTYFFTTFEYRPPFFLDDEFADNIITVTDFGFHIEIRNINDASIYKHYFILHNNSGNPLNHDYIDFSDFMNTNGTHSIQYFKDDKLVFMVKADGYQTILKIYRVDSIDPVTKKPSLTFLKEKVGLKYTYNSPDIIVESNAIRSLGTIYYFAIIKKFNNKYYIARPCGIWIGTTSGSYEGAIMDYFIYDPTNNSIQYRNEEDKPIRVLREHNRPYFKLGEVWRHYYIREYIIPQNNKYFIHITGNTMYDKCYFYIGRINNFEGLLNDLMWNVDYTSQLASFGTLPKDASPIGKGLYYVMLYKFKELSNDLIILQGRSYNGSSVVFKNCAIYGFDRENPVNFEVTKIEEISAPLNYHIYYLNNNKDTRIFSCLPYPDTFVYYDTYDDVKNNNYIIFDTNSLNLDAILNDIVTNFRPSDHTDPSLIVSKAIRLLPYKVDDYYLIKFAYEYRNSDFSINRPTFGLCLVDSDGSIFKLYIEQENRDGSSYRSTNFPSKVNDFIYENENALYILCYYNYFTVGGSSTRLVVYKLNKPFDYNINKTNKKYPGGDWERQNIGLHEKYGLFFTNSHPNDHTDLIYYVDDSITDFDQRMVNSLEQNPSSRRIDYMLQVRGSYSFVISWESIDIFIKNKYYLIEQGTLDLHTVKSDPSNSQFYLYIEYNPQEDKIEIKVYDNPQEINENRIYYCDIFTDDVGVYRSEVKGTVYSLNQFGVSNKKNPQSIVISGSTTRLDESLFPKSSRNSLRIISTNISAQSSISYNLDDLFNSTSRNAIMCNIYLLQDGSYVENQDTIQVKIDSNFENLQLTNYSTSDVSILVVLEELRSI